jgi:hypothetical protein
MPKQIILAITAKLPKGRLLFKTVYFSTFAGKSSFSFTALKAIADGSVSYHPTQLSLKSSECDTEISRNVCL